MTYNERIPLTGPDFNVIDNEREGIYAFNLNDGHVVIVDVELVGRMAAHCK